MLLASAMDSEAMRRRTIVIGGIVRMLAAMAIVGLVTVAFPEIRDGDGSVVVQVMLRMLLALGVFIVPVTLGVRRQLAQRSLRASRAIGSRATAL